MWQNRKESRMWFGNLHHKQHSVLCYWDWRIFQVLLTNKERKELLVITAFPPTCNAAADFLHLNKPLRAESITCPCGQGQYKGQGFLCAKIAMIFISKIKRKTRTPKFCRGRPSAFVRWGVCQVYCKRRSLESALHFPRSPACSSVYSLHKKNELKALISAAII